MGQVTTVAGRPGPTAEAVPAFPMGLPASSAMDAMMAIAAMAHQPPRRRTPLEEALSAFFLGPAEGRTVYPGSEAGLPGVLRMLATGEEE